MANFTLRQYQEEAVEAAMDFLHNEAMTEPGLIIAPTGAGKSLLVAAIVSRLSGGVIVFQPSRELLRQNLAKYLAFGGIAGVYAASLGQKQRAKVTLALLGSVVKKAALFQHVKYLILDEAHLYPPAESSMFKKFVAGLPVGIKILGLTASPFRLESTRTGSKLVMLDQCSPAFFKHIVHTTQISTLTAQAFWSPLEYIEQTFDFKGLKVNSTGADYTEESLAAAASFIEGRVLEATNLPYTKGVVFLPTVEQAHRLSLIVERSAYVCGATPEAERDSILKDFLAGRIRTIFNVNVLAVGFDAPELDCVILARPTMSGAMFYQQVGRATRIHPNKKRAIICDLVGNLDKFGPVENFIFKKYRGHIEMYNGNTKITGRNLADIIIKRKEAAQMEEVILEAKTKKIVLAYEDAIIDFGTHNGKKISQVPRSWLHWAVQNIDSKKTLIKNIRLFLAAKS